MIHTAHDEYYKSTLNLIEKFIDSNQRKRINLLRDIESEVENIFAIGNKLFDAFDKDGDDWAVGWLLQVLKKHKPIFFEDKKFNNWFLTYSEDNMSGLDLQTIDRLWNIYSNGKFGFSTQARILKSVGNKYELLWPKIGWKKENFWTRYPNSFCWSLAAPEGHMPLINQLRGVRLMDSILKHPAISSRHNNIL